MLTYISPGELRFWGFTNPSQHKGRIIDRPIRSFHHPKDSLGMGHGPASQLDCRLDCVQRYQHIPRLLGIGFYEVNDCRQPRSEPA